MTKKNQGLKILGIETSCDETAVAIVNIKENYKGKILSNKIFSQNKEHSPYGGVVPEIASRSHVEHLDDLIDQALKDSGLSFDNFDGIAVTSGPGLIGGLIVGMATAKGLSLATNVPLIGVNHLEGHALTPLLTNGTSFPYILLLVSGGHCQLIIVEALGKYSKIGTTLDDAVGEAFDKAAKFMGLGYPGGPELEKLALRGNPYAFDLPRPLVNQDNCNFSFSGLKTAFIRLARSIEPVDEKTSADLAASYQQAIIDCLINRLSKSIEIVKELRPDLKIKNLVASGGVAANKGLVEQMQEFSKEKNMQFISPPIEFCTDNAAMIAWAGGLRLSAGMQDPLGINAKARWPLEEVNIN